MTNLQSLAMERIVALNEQLRKTLPLVWNCASDYHPSYTREKAEVVSDLLYEQENWLLALQEEDAREQ
jgi:hypothetical protein